MCIKWNCFQKFVFGLLLSFLVILPTGTAFADDTRSFPQYGATVNANGDTGTGDVWPKSILQKAWDHCGEDHCDGVPICVLNKEVTVLCGLEQTCTYPISRTVKFSGQYSGGWTTRDNWVNALLEYSGENGGWYDNAGTWAMRSFWAVRSPNNGDWINVNVEGGREAMAPCGN